ncbi:ProQ/FinO family protein [Cupriavidus basilensis]
MLQAIVKLQKRFPQTFPKNPAPKVSLKIGIFEDLVPHAQGLGLTEPALRDAMRTWCRGTRYWTCLVEGAPRVDLVGQAAGHVSLADASRARERQTQRAARALSQPAVAPKPN